MSEDALIRLGRSTSAAIAGVLEMYAPGKIVAGDVQVFPADRLPLEGFPVPSVSTNVSYVDGVTGGNTFVMTLDGARLLAAAMMGMEEPEDPNAPELSELELSAVSEAMNQMMASAAGATGSVLGTEVEIGTPETQTFTTADEAAAAFTGGSSGHTIQASFTVCDAPCRLVQNVPNAFVVRMTRALDELGSEIPTAATTAGSAPAAAASPTGLAPSLAGIPVRVWAELGRARMPSAELVGLPSGAVVELNRDADEPIDLFVNGRRFATGRLMLVDDDWAVRIETILENPATESQMEVASWPESW
jgi:flagellar motor switch protein FliN/FliY